MGKNDGGKAATANKPKGPEGALDVDGTNPDTFIDESVKSSGLSRDEWFKKFNAAAAKTGHPADVHDGASLQSYLDGIYGPKGNNYGKVGGNGVYGTLTKIQRANSTYKLNDEGKRVIDKSFFYDPAWQYKSSAKYQSRTLVTEYTEEEKKAHLKDGSWVEVTKGKGKNAPTEVYAVGKPQYVDPSKLNLIARPKGEGQLGDIYRVTDASNPSNYTYAMLFDRSPAAKASTVTEVSNPVFSSLGKTANPVKGTSAHLYQESVGHSDLYERFQQTGILPTQEEIQAAGERLDKAKKLKPLPNTPNTGAYQFPKGDDTILLGPKKLPAVFKGSMHTGGGVIADASQTTFYGKAKNPAGRVDDPTSDGYNVFTGEDSLEIG